MIKYRPPIKALDKIIFNVDELARLKKTKSLEEFKALKREIRPDYVDVFTALSIEKREKDKARRREYNLNRLSDPMVREAHNANAAQYMRDRLADPEFRQIQNERTKASARKRMADPVKRERQRERQRKYQREYYRNRRMEAKAAKEASDAE